MSFPNSFVSQKYDIILSKIVCHIIWAIPDIKWENVEAPLAANISPVFSVRWAVDSDHCEMFITILCWSVNVELIRIHLM